MMVTSKKQQQKQDDNTLPMQKPFKRVRFDDAVKVKDGTKANSSKQLILPEHEVILSLDSVTNMVSYLIKTMSDKLQGFSASYFNLVEYLKAKPPGKIRPDPDRLAKWLRALTQIVSSLTPSYSALVDVALDADTICLSTDNMTLANSWSTLLENLVSAHAHYITPVCQRLIYAFRKGSTPAMRAHSCLKNVLHLIPTGPSFLAPIISQAFPHKGMNVTDHYHYLDGILKLISYAPVLREHVLALAVDRAIQIDVEIQSGIDELEEDVAINDAVFEALFSLPVPCDGVTHRSSVAVHDSINRQDEGKNGDDDDEEDDEDDSDYEDELAQPLVVSIRDTIQKLDAVLHLLFCYVASTTSPSLSTSKIFPNYLTSPSSSSVKNHGNKSLNNLFPCLLDIFERSLLPTHRSRYTQFLWFYACSLDSSLPDAFLACLVQRTFDDSASPAIRVSASAYIGSFLARASYLSTSLVKTCISLLNSWAVKYIQQIGHTVGFVAVGSHAEECRRHLVFYSVVQSIMYTFCFRWKEFICNEEASVVYKHKFPPELTGFENVLRNTRLNPLKYCASPIVKEFATLTSDLQILFLFTIVQSNIRSQPPNSPPLTPLLTNGTNSEAAGRDNKIISSADVLDTFFPFDPFHLPKSKKFVELIYIEWKGNGEEVEEEYAGDERVLVGESDEDE